MKNWRLAMCACAIGAISIACGDDPVSDTDSGTPPVDSGMAGTDSGMAMTDSGTPGTDSGAPDTDSGTPDTDSGTTPTVTFAMLRSGLSSCALAGTCHGGTTNPFSMGGSDAEYYAELTSEDPSSAGCASLTARVVPNDTAMSVLYIRTHGGSPCGSMMPASTMQRQLIEDYINAGAPAP